MASRSGFDKSLSKKVGLACEKRVVDFLQAKGYSLLASNLRTPFAEVDLIFQGKRSVVMLEVKSLLHQDYKWLRVRSRQKKRLIRAMSWVRNYFKAPVELFYVYVSDRKIEFVREEGN